PIVVGNEAIGALAFSDAVSGFSEAKAEFGENLGVSLSLALANARSFEATEQALSDAQGLHRISTDMTKSLDIAETLETGLDEAMDAIAVKYGCIYVRDELGTLTIRSQRNLTPEFLAAKTVVAQGEGCAGEAAETQETYAPTEETGHFICADSQKLLRLDCLAAVPIVYKGNTMGVLEMFAPVFRRISERERNIAEAIAGQLAISLENARLFADQRNIADTLQGILLVLPDRISGLAFGHAYHSSTEVAKVGGDFYDLFEVDDDKVCIIIGDVSGKGLEVATLTSLVKNTVRAYIYEHDSIPKALSMTNEIVIAGTRAFDFVSLWVGVLDKHSGQLVYCNAGHPPSIIKRKTGKSFFLEATSPVVGVLAGLDYVVEETHLEIGDVLILYTDGVIEAREGRRFFGEDRLINFVKDLKKRDIKKIPADILERVFSYTGSRIADDVAILSISRTLPSK
ncbi:MAG: SpoIIE family protein phosphatase, partial [Actinomycetia bacterium]|nr:SpoIIE family protein phosphatase [Actinomycetes bacterium]